MTLCNAIKRHWLKWKAKHWDIDLEIMDDPHTFAVFFNKPPLRARWEAIKPHLRKRGPEIIVGVLVGIIVTLLLALFGL